MENQNALTDKILKLPNIHEKEEEEEEEFPREKTRDGGQPQEEWFLQRPSRGEVITSELSENRSQQRNRKH